MGMFGFPSDSIRKEIVAYFVNVLVVIFALLLFLGMSLRNIHHKTIIPDNESVDISLRVLRAIVPRPIVAVILPFCLAIVIVSIYSLFTGTATPIDEQFSDDGVDIIVNLETDRYHSGEQIRAAITFTQSVNESVEDIYFSRETRLLNVTINSSLWTINRRDSPLLRNEPLLTTTMDQIPPFISFGNVDYLFHISPNNSTWYTVPVRVHVYPSYQYLLLLISSCIVIAGFLFFVFTTTGDRLIKYWTNVATSTLRPFLDDVRDGISTFSTGQDFVFIALFSLAACPFLLILKHERLAEEMAIITYFCLVVGVINLYYENMVEERRVRSDVRFRKSLSFIVLMLLISLSIDDGFTPQFAHITLISIGTFALLWTTEWIPYDRRINVTAFNSTFRGQFPPEKPLYTPMIVLLLYLISPQHELILFAALIASIVYCMHWNRDWRYLFFVGLFLGLAWMPTEGPFSREVYLYGIASVALTVLSILGITDSARVMIDIERKERPLIDHIHSVRYRIYVICILITLFLLESSNHRIFPLGCLVGSHVFLAAYSVRHARRLGYQSSAA